MEATQVKTQTQQNAPAQFKPPKKKRRWVRRRVAVLVGAAILAVLLLRLMSAGTQAVAGAYLSDTAQVREMTVAVSGTGTIQPNQSYKVTTLIQGEVLEAPFEEGQTVHKGDLLFRIDSKDVEASIRQAELSLESARLSSSRTSPTARKTPPSRPPPPAWSPSCMWTRGTWCRRAHPSPTSWTGTT